MHFRHLKSSFTLARPTGSRFFCFNMQIFRNVAALGVDVPPTRLAYILRENPVSATDSRVQPITHGYCTPSADIIKLWTECPKSVNNHRARMCVCLATLYCEAGEWCLLQVSYISTSSLMCSSSWVVLQGKSPHNLHCFCVFFAKFDCISIRLQITLFQF